LAKEDSPTDILLAPFDMRYMLKATTFVPVGLAVVLASLQQSAFDSAKKDGEKEYDRSKVTKDDAFYAGAFSFNAGTHEEAVFRGWIMPEFRELTGSDLWSNLIQSTFFALAHLGDNQLPLPQFGLGYYLGHLTQQNNWSFKESVFIHTWWDIIIFSSMYRYEKRPKSAKTSATRLIAPVLWLPPLQLVF
jgi:membrane protease YdiL (CAAX protease family)